MEVDGAHNDNTDNVAPNNNHINIDRYHASPNHHNLDNDRNRTVPAADRTIGALPGSVSTAINRILETIRRSLAQPCGVRCFVSTRENMSPMESALETFAYLQNHGVLYEAAILCVRAAGVLMDAERALEDHNWRLEITLFHLTKGGR